MAVVSIADVLHRAEEFEGMLADYYHDVAEHSSKEGVKMLSDCMSRHRIRIARTTRQARARADSANQFHAVAL